MVDIPEISTFLYFYFQEQSNRFRLSIGNFYKKFSLNIVSFLVQVQVLMKGCMRRFHLLLIFFILKLTSITRHHSRMWLIYGYSCMTIILVLCLIFSSYTSTPHIAIPLLLIFTLIISFLLPDVFSILWSS